MSKYTLTVVREVRELRRKLASAQEEARAERYRADSTGRALDKVLHVAKEALASIPCTCDFDGGHKDSCLFMKRVRFDRRLAPYIPTERTT